MRLFGSLKTQHVNMVKTSGKSWCFIRTPMWIRISLLSDCLTAYFRPCKFGLLLPVICEDLALYFLGWKTAKVLKFGMENLIIDLLCNDVYWCALHLTLWYTVLGQPFPPSLHILHGRSPIDCFASERNLGFELGSSRGSDFPISSLLQLKIQHNPWGSGTVEFWGLGQKLNSRHPWIELRQGKKGLLKGDWSGAPRGPGMLPFPQLNFVPSPEPVPDHRVATNG